MAHKKLEMYVNNVYVSDLIPTNGETANRITSYDGNDRITGNQYNDFIFTGGGDDTVMGGYGNDALHPQGGVNFLYGNEGDDIFQALSAKGTNHMVGGFGNDSYIGHDGTDIFYFEYGKGVDTVQDYYDTTPAQDDGVNTLVLDFKLTDAYFNKAPDGKSLLVGTKADAADGVLSSYVLIENHFVDSHSPVDNFLFTDTPDPLTLGF